MLLQNLEVRRWLIGLGLLLCKSFRQLLLSNLAWIHSDELSVAGMQIVILLRVEVCHFAFKICKVEFWFFRAGLVLEFILEVWLLNFLVLLFRLGEGLLKCLIGLPQHLFLPELFPFKNLTAFGHLSRHSLDLIAVLLISMLNLSGGFNLDLQGTFVALIAKLPVLLELLLIVLSESLLLKNLERLWLVKLLL